MKKRNPLLILLRVFLMLLLAFGLFWLSGSDGSTVFFPEVIPISTKNENTVSEKETETTSTAPVLPPDLNSETDESRVSEEDAFAWAVKYASLYHVDPYLIISIAEVESSFNPKALSSAGAMGLTQIKPDTYEVDIKANLNLTEEADALYNPEFSIRCCAYYVSWLQYRLKQVGTASVAQTAAAYHGGINTVRAWLADEKYSHDGELDYEAIADVAPLTANYVDKILYAYESWKQIPIQ